MAARESPAGRGCFRQKGEAEHKVCEQGTEGFRVAGPGAAGGQEGGQSSRWERVLGGGFSTSVVDSQELREERTRGSRVLAVTRGCHSLMPTCAWHMPMMTMATFSPGTRFCFSEIWLLSPHRNPGWAVLLFLFTGKLRYILQATQLESGQARCVYTPACLASEPALFCTLRCFPWMGRRGWEGSPGNSKGNSVGKGMAGKMLNDQ